jgi:DNA modification methylase
MVKLIQDFTAPEEIVIDPFLGSGTTLFACEELGRVCFAAEKSPEYCQLIIDKYESSYGSN